MDHRTFESARDRIRYVFPALSPVLRAAASYALDHPEEVLMQSMRGLAKLAKVPPVTLVRLALALGYAGWPEVKAAFARDMGLMQTTTSYSTKARDLIQRSEMARKDSQDAQLMSELITVHQQGLQRHATHNAAHLRATARTMIAAPHVHVAGFRASYALAYALAYVYRLFRPGVALIDGHAGGLEMQMRRLQHNDACIVIGFSAYSSESIKVAEMAQHKKCSIIAITDSETSPLSLVANHTLLFSVQSPSFFPSTTAGMGVVEALMEWVITESDAQVVQDIRDAEQQLHESGAYTPSN